MMKITMSNKAVVTLAICISAIQIAGLVQQTNGAGEAAPAGGSGGGSNSLTVRCSTAIQQVTSCLTFVTAKDDKTVPSKECCTAVSSMREKQAVCLCFFIGQAHNGSEQIKSLGIQEAKLLQLPSACQLPNADVSNCPKLLGISPTSPAAAIFMNNATSPSGSASPSSTAATATATPNSSGFKHYGSNGLLGVLIAISISVFVSAFPSGILHCLF